MVFLENLTDGGGKLIYKIKFKGKSFNDIISELYDSGNFCYQNGFFFIDIEDTSKLSILGEEDELMIIDKFNYTKFTTGDVRAWCLDVLSKQELVEFERTEECQNRLKEVMTYLDKIESGGDISE